MKATDPSVFERLQRWYLAECNGDWEHSYGVKIDTLDNPGWVVTIDLFETGWADLNVPLEKVQRSDTDWLQVEVSGSRFVGCGGPLNLEQIIECFFDVLGSD
jgi:Immunity protein 53